MLIGCAQAVEHYEIARYGVLKTWATQLGLGDAAKLLDETLSEEKATDEKLSQIAEAAANASAGQGAVDEDEEEEDEEEQQAKKDAAELARGDKAKGSGRKTA